MRLDHWLSDKKVTREDFAARIEVEAASLSRYITGQRVPRPRVMRRIFEETAGQVTANDFISVQEPIPNPNGADGSTGVQAAE